MAAEEDSEECTCKLLSTKLPPAAAQKFQTAYHLMIDCEQLQTPLLVSPVALIKLHRRARSRVAWTEFGGVGEGRRTSLRQIDKIVFSDPGHPGLDPV